MIKITKKRQGEMWRIYADGKPTPFTIEKGLPAKYARTQTYDVMHDLHDMYCFETKSVSGAMEIFSLIANVGQPEEAA